MIRYLILAVLCLPSLFGYSQIRDTTWSQQLWSDSIYAERPKVGLALSGGAAHGLAHIGVLQYMEEVGIHVDYITGTSMGAIIGALYALGYDAASCGAVAADTQWDEVLSTQIKTAAVAPVEKYKHDKYPVSLDLNGSKLIIPAGILSSSRLDLLLEEMFARAHTYTDFDSFPIPFRCYAVDIVDGSIVEMNSGSLARAVRASMAIPSVFSPVHMDGRTLVDGGLIRNLPVSNCRDMGADIVIGSYVGSDRGDAGQLSSLLDILKQSAFMMSISDSEQQQSQSDILVVPDVKEESAIDFYNYENLIKRGYEEAVQHAEEFELLKELQQRYPQPQPQSTLSDPGFIFIDEVIVDSKAEDVSQLVLHKLNVANRSFATFGKITKGIEAVYATKNFKNVDYELRYKPEGADLLITVDEVQHNELGANINHFASSRSALVLSLQARNLLGKLSNMDVTARVSENPGLSTHFYRRGGMLNDGLVYGLSAKMERLDLPFKYRNDAAADMKLWDGTIAPYIMLESSSNMSLKMYWQADYYKLSNTITRLGDLDSYDMSQYSLGLELRYDNLNDKYFTKSGVSAWLLGQYAYAQTAEITVAGGGELSTVREPRPFLMPRVHVTSFHPLSDRWNIQGTVDGAFKREGYFLDNVYIGGTDQDRQDRLPFIGLVESDLHVQTYGYAKVALRRQLTGITYISLIAQGMVGNSPTIQYVAPQGTESIISLWSAGVSVGLDLPTGPLLLDVGYSSYTDGVGVAFSLGYRHIY